MPDFRLDFIYANLQFRKRSLELFAESINLYVEYLQKYLSPKAEALALKHRKAVNILQWLEENEDQVLGEWEMVFIQASNETLQIIKSCLPYLIERTSKEIGKLEAEGAPHEAADHLRSKIDQAKELMGTGVMSDIPTVEIMGKISTKKLSVDVPKVFYSWQSDVKPVRNKFTAALEIALKQMGEELEEAQRPELDSDTKGSFASVDIMTTIFKKIDEAAVFVADVTPIATKGEKLIPNPNVMSELGYALKSNPDRCLFIYSSDEKGSMPFDISGKNLLRFSRGDQPAAVAKVLAPRLKGMLDSIEAKTDGGDEFPYIYVSGASFSQWSDGTTMTLTIRNSEQDEYMLKAVEIEGMSAEPKRSLRANDDTKGIAINNVPKTFDKPEPLVKMTLTRAGKEYRLEQKIVTDKGADGLYHFRDFVQEPTLVRY